MRVIALRPCTALPSSRRSFLRLPRNASRASLSGHQRRALRVRSMGGSSDEGSGPVPKQLVVVGSLNADLLLEVPRIPAPGETLSAGGGRWIPGGKGANQAAAAGNLGYSTLMVAQVGNDSHAGMICGALTDRGVSTEHVSTVDGPTGQAVIMLQPTGENSIIIVGGANRMWAEPTSSAMKVLEHAGAVMLQREVPESVNMAAAAAGKAAACLVVLDAGGDEGPLPPRLLANIDILSPNETELARLTGMPTSNKEDALAAAKSLLAQGVQQVLVKLGSQGSMLVRADGSVLQQCAIPVPQVIDTTAAGDSFTAAFIVALLEGKSAECSLEFAAAAASLCIQRLGALQSLPSRDETMAVIEQLQACKSS